MGNRGRILLVEAEARDREECARALGQAGFEVTEVPDRVDANRLLNAEHFDVVLSDVSARAVNGLRLLREIRAKHTDVPVVLLADPSVTDARSAREEGAVACLEKPIAPDALKHALEQAVSFSRRHSLAAFRNRRGADIDIASFTATEAKNEFGRVLQTVARDGVVVIRRHDAPEAVLLSVDEFRDLTRAREDKLEALRSEFDVLLAKMQTPESRAGMEAAFDATPARMGAASVAASRKRG